MNRRVFCSSLIGAPAALAAPTKSKRASITSSVSPSSAKPHKLLFAASSLHDLYINMDRRDWSRLTENVLANDYYPASLSWNGTSAPEIRLRARGRQSRDARKPSLRVDLKAGGKKSPIPKVHGFVLNNLAGDATCLHDWLALKLFRKAGVATPRRSFARVFVNNQYYGVYSLGEEVDEHFLQRHFREHKGHLYQYHSAPGTTHESASAGQGLKAVNHRKAQKPERNATILSGLRTGKLAALGGHKNAPPDVRHLATVLAVESFCDDRQGFLSESGPDGLYYYSARKPPMAHVIPWGRNDAFLAWQRPLFHQVDLSPVAQRLLAQDYAREVYHETIAELAALGGSNAWLEQKILDRASALRGAVLEDPYRSQTRASFDDAIQELLVFALRRGDHLKSQL